MPASLSSTHHVLVKASRDVFRDQGLGFSVWRLSSPQNPGAASPLMTLTFYPELKDTHDLVLLKGDILSPAALKPAEASHVSRVIVESYSDANRFHWVQTFNLNPREFSFDEFKNACPDFFAFPLPEVPNNIKLKQTDTTNIWLL